MNLTKYAQRDLRLARKEGRMAVCQTKIGTIWIEYSNRVYTFTNNNGETLYQGGAKGAETALCNSYQVVTE